MCEWVSSQPSWVVSSSGVSIHTFHGNFFVRSPDLVSLPNVSPDSGFSMQLDIEDSLTDSNMAVFQSALLYTNSKGKLVSYIWDRKNPGNKMVLSWSIHLPFRQDRVVQNSNIMESLKFLDITVDFKFSSGERRIRVHTLGLPITNKLADLYATADVQAVATLLTKMGQCFNVWIVVRFVWAVFELLWKVITRFRFATPRDWLKNLVPVFRPMRSEIKANLTLYARFSRSLSKFKVIAMSSDWFIALFARLVIGRCSYFAIGFSTVIWKPLSCQALRRADYVIPEFHTFLHQGWSGSDMDNVALF